MKRSGQQERECYICPLGRRAKISPELDNKSIQGKIKMHLVRTSFSCTDMAGADNNALDCSGLKFCHLLL